jgi:hypothetical protein
MTEFEFYTEIWVNSTKKCMNSTEFQMNSQIIENLPPLNLPNFSKFGQIYKPWSQLVFLHKLPSEIHTHMQVPEAFHKESFINKLCTSILTYMVLFPTGFLLIDCRSGFTVLPSALLLEQPVVVRCWMGLDLLSCSYR